MVHWPPSPREDEPWWGGSGTYHHRFPKYNTVQNAKLFASGEEVFIKLNKGVTTPGMRLGDFYPTWHIYRPDSFINWRGDNNSPRACTKQTHCNLSIGRTVSRLYALLCSLIMSRLSLASVRFEGPALQNHPTCKTTAKKRRLSLFIIGAHAERSRVLSK